MSQLTTTTERVRRSAVLTRREQLIVLEIGADSIDSASAFVSYLSESYGFSKSSVWYNLNRLKEKGLVDFATKDEPGKALTLTKYGVQEMKGMERAGLRLEAMESGRMAPWPTVQQAADYVAHLHRRTQMRVESPMLVRNFG